MLFIPPPRSELFHGLKFLPIGVLYVPPILPLAYYNSNPRRYARPELDGVFLLFPKLQIPVSKVTSVSAATIDICSLCAVRYANGCSDPLWAIEKQQRTTTCLNNVNMAEFISTSTVTIGPLAVHITRYGLGLYQIAELSSTLVLQALYAPQGLITNLYRHYAPRRFDIFPTLGSHIQEALTVRSKNKHSAEMTYSYGGRIYGSTSISIPIYTNCLMEWDDTAQPDGILIDYGGISIEKGPTFQGPRAALIYNNNTTYLGNVNHES